MRKAYPKAERESGACIAKKGLAAEPVETLEDALGKPKKIRLTVEEFGELSMEIQRELLGD